MEAIYRFNSYSRHDPARYTLFMFQYTYYSSLSRPTY